MKKPKPKKPIPSKSTAVVKQEGAPKAGPPAPITFMREVENHAILQVHGFLEAGYVERSDDKILVEALRVTTAVSAKDELEALLGAQMAATHHMVMKFFMRANIREQTSEGIDVNLARANKLMRTYLQQVEALDKHRGKGQQKVTVEHVTVNQGGQAIIGTVERPQGGGGI